MYTHTILPHTYTTHLHDLGEALFCILLHRNISVVAFTKFRVELTKASEEPVLLLCVCVCVCVCVYMYHRNIPAVTFTQFRVELTKASEEPVLLL